MAKKKYLVEVEEGHTECKNCPFRVTSKGCATFKCGRVNLATMKITEMEDSQCEK
jgi:tRNA(Ile2) C34 agmatinyltransferase TiaS